MSKRRLYNEEQKRKYMEETIQNQYSRQRAQSIFGRFAPYEEQADADMCTFPEDRITEIIDQIYGIRVTSKYTMTSAVRQYMAWCVNQGIPDAKTYNELPKKSYRKNAGVMNDVLVRNPAHLQICLDRAFDPESMMTQDNVFRCFLWLAYGGMSDAVAFDVTAKDVNFDYMEVSHGDDVALIYRQAVPCFKNCVTLTQFQYFNPAYTKKGSIQRDRAPGDRILRGFRGDPELQILRVQLSRKLKLKKDQGIATEMLSYQKVWLAGVFFRIFEGEQAGIEPDFDAIAVEASEKCAMSERPVFLKRNYDRWKTAGAQI